MFINNCRSIHQMYTGIGTGSQGCPSPPRPNAQIPPKSLSTPPIEKPSPLIMTQGVQAVPGGLGSMEYPPVKGENLKIKTSKLEF